MFQFVTTVRVHPEDPVSFIFVDSLLAICIYGSRSFFSLTVTPISSAHSLAVSSKLSEGQAKVVQAFSFKFSRFIFRCANLQPL